MGRVFMLTAVKPSLGRNLLRNLPSLVLFSVCEYRLQSGLSSRCPSLPNIFMENFHTLPMN